ncbi:MAG: cytochrome C peroxidase [Saprospiraceae bacterium]|nr:cytochrome C peroxidase [Saprospiraceae bacterium]
MKLCLPKMLSGKYIIFYLLAMAILIWMLGSAFGEVRSPAEKWYANQVLELRKELQQLSEHDSLRSDHFKHQLHKTRLSLKKIDFWLRYLEPIAYKLINGPLPLEWETEVFEKFEPPYPRWGGGLTLAENYLEETIFIEDSILHLLDTAEKTCDVFWHDSIRIFLRRPDAFFYAQRLFLLNLSAIYTTGFECPDSARIIPELKEMCEAVLEIQLAHNESFLEFKLADSFMNRYRDMLVYLQSKTDDWSEFSHFHFIRDFVDPLFGMNQEMIRKYKVRSQSFNDFSLSRNAQSIFDKNLYEAQDDQGVFRSVRTESQKNEIFALGKLLFYDPVLSSNNQRACASCHVPSMLFTDTTKSTAFQFDKIQKLERNTPSLIESIHQHLLMLDGKHFNLMNQMKDVMSNPIELNMDTLKILKKVMSITEYKLRLNSVSKYTSYSKPQFEHIAGAITMYLSQFAYQYSAFDSMIFKQRAEEESVIKGFNLFMGKAQCGTCHFPPQFNGVKPPYVGSEFEVLGTPSDTSFKKLSQDQGRYKVWPVKEMKGAFRTPTIRNSHKTKPYMHNGVFWTLEEVIDFYNHGGGVGNGLELVNQTLSSDSLRLSNNEIADLIFFICSLDENIQAGNPPESLPLSKNKKLTARKPGGEY